MALKKIIQPDEVLFRFDHERPNAIKGGHYCSRTVVMDGDVVISSVQNPAESIDVGAGVKGLDLKAILGTVVLGQQAKMDEQTAAIEAHNKAISDKDAELAAKDGVAQELLARVEAAEKKEAEAVAAAEKAATIVGSQAELDAKDAIIQGLMGQLADLEAKA